MKVLVTGGAGYIGSHTCQELARQGMIPVYFDNLSYGHTWAASSGELEIGDLLDPARLREVLARHRPQAVMHFAAFAQVGESVAHPDRYYRNNVVGSLNLLDAMRAAEVPYLIFSSTCAVYGLPSGDRLDESCQRSPINPYGRSKLIVEDMLADHGQAYGLRSVALRYFNAAGADEEGHLGEQHDPETHLIPTVMQAALGQRGPVSIFGRDYPTPDGTCIRDYIHVRDLARAHVQALRLLQAGRELAPAYNLGSGQGYSVLEIIRGVEEVSGRTVPTVWGERRPGDPPRLVALTDKARRELNWETTCSGLHHILTTAWNWHSRSAGRPVG